ncbi:MAG: hypothetical protein GC162_12145 [Planctomycetes bacterium]|nr:hypothetical protein [Planctomycetota bacterium]
MPHVDLARRSVAALILVSALLVAPLRAESNSSRLDRREELEATIKQMKTTIASLTTKVSNIQAIVDEQKKAYEASEKKIADTQASLAEQRKAIGDRTGELNQITASLNAEVDQDPAIAEAMKAVDEAKKPYDERRDKLSVEIVKTDAYLKVADELKMKQERLDLLNGSTAAVDENELAGLRIEVVNLQTRVGQALEDALSRDPELAAMKEKLDAANDKLKELRGAMLAKVRDDPKRVDAEKAVTEARQKVAQLSHDLLDANRENMLVKSKYARAYGVLQQTQKELDQKNFLLKGLYDELKATYRDN